MSTKATKSYNINTYCSHIKHQLNFCKSNFHTFLLQYLFSLTIHLKAKINFHLPLLHHVKEISMPTSPPICINWCSFIPIGSITVKSHFTGQFKYLSTRLIHTSKEKKRCVVRSLSFNLFFNYYKYYYLFLHYKIESLCQPEYDMIFFNGQYKISINH